MSGQLVEQWPVKTLGDFIVNRRQNLDPRKFPDEIFEHYSVPSHSTGSPIPTAGSEIGSTKYILTKGDVLLSKINPHLNRTWVVGESDYRMIGSGEWIQFPVNDEIDSRYLSYYLSQQKFADYCIDNTSGVGGSLTRTKISAVEKYPIPIPHLEEQQRIASILDEALGNSKSMLDECKKKLLNSVELFRSLLHSIFDQSQCNVSWNSNGIQFPKLEVFQPLNEQLPSSTRGRKETERTIEGNLSLSVGLPSIIPRKGWSWSKLTNLARLESGHTPSRKFPEYWGGDVPWIGIKDAKKNYGKIIMNTLELTNQLGLANSAARLLPKGTVCLSRTASVGYVVVMGTEMATSQDFVNWVCAPELNPHFLKFLLMAERDGFTNYSSGAVHQTIYFPEVKAFHICHPDIDTQRLIAQYLNGACLQFESLQKLYREEVEVLQQLSQSILQEAFNGTL
jgi:type I restriction enzyme, S subunit